MKANKKNWFYDDKDFLHTWSKMKESRFYLLCSFLVNLLCVHFSMLYLLKTWSSQKRNPEITLLCWLVWVFWLHPVKQGELWFSSIPEEGGVDFKHFVTLGVLGMQRSIVLVNLLIFSLHILTMIVVIRSRKPAHFPSGFCQVYLFYCWSNGGL